MSPSPSSSLFYFCPFLQGPEKEMDAIQAKEEVKKAREEDEEDLLMGKFHRHNHFSRFHRQGEL
jgi:calreticulin 3